MPNRVLQLFTVICLGAALACGSAATKSKNKGGSLRVSDDARTAYERALLDFRRGDCLAAEPLFREIRREFPYSRFAALSELRIGDCQFKAEKYPESIQTFRQFVRIRPSHKEIPYARFRIAEA
ncbi:MAG: outer membrane protein assembly factor BamD, partial [Myxococcota bacterium]